MISIINQKVAVKDTSFTLLSHRSHACLFLIKVDLSESNNGNKFTQDCTRHLLHSDRQRVAMP